MYLTKANLMIAIVALKPRIAVYSKLPAPFQNQLEHAGSIVPPTFFMVSHTDFNEVMMIKKQSRPLQPFSTCPTVAPKDWLLRL